MDRTSNSPRRPISHIQRRGLEGNLPVRTVTPGVNKMFSHGALSTLDRYIPVAKSQFWVSLNDRYKKPLAQVTSLTHFQLIISV